MYYYEKGIFFYFLLNMLFAFGAQSPCNTQWVIYGVVQIGIRRHIEQKNSEESDGGAKFGPEHYLLTE